MKTNKFYTRITLLVLSVLFLSLTAGCSSRNLRYVEPSGKDGMREYPLKSISKLTFALNASNAHITLKQGDEASATIYTDEAYFSSLDVKVRGESAEFVAPSRLDRKVEIVIVLPEYQYISCIGAANIVSEQGHVLTGKVLETNISGACSLDLNLDYETFKSDVSGASSLLLSGRADNAFYHFSGASALDALLLKTQTAEVNISGTGSVCMHVEQKLKVSASGATSIEVAGPAEIEKHLSGLTVVTRIDPAL